MSSCKNRGFFPEFERRAQQVSSNDRFRSCFNKFSHNGNRIGMIRSLLDALETSNISIGDLYCAKNEVQAKKLLQEVDSMRSRINVSYEKITSILTEALASAPSQSKIFFEILVQRARAWYQYHDLIRCIKDCQYFLDAISNVKNDALMEEDRIDVLLLYSDCSKAMDSSNTSNSYLNEAMRRINDLAEKRCDNEGNQSEYFKIKKVELLKYFLGRKQQSSSWKTLPNIQKIFCEAEKEIPVVEGKTNDFLRSCSDAIAVGKDKVKGRLLYAVRDINPGSVLIVDHPFSFSTDITALHRNCLCCHISLWLQDIISVPCENCQTVRYCSQKCREQAWNKFHKYECRIFNYFYEIKFQKTNSHLAYRTVINALHDQDSALKINQEFLQLHRNDTTAFDINTLKKYESSDYKTVFNLETHCAVSNPKDNLEQAIHSIFFSKCLIYSLNYFHTEIGNHEEHLQMFAVALLHNMQAINCNAYEIVENVRDDETKILEPRYIGGAIYTSVSLSNHSCYPNIVRHSFPSGIVVVRSICFIPKGSEILDCYGQHFLENKRNLRRKLLTQKYYFQCQCEACASDWPITLSNDQFHFKCKNCFKPYNRIRNIVECAACGHKIEINKLYTLLQNSIKKRLKALTKMYNGKYEDALLLLIEHASCINKILLEPSLETIKTQQSIIQCFNATSSTSIKLPII